MVVDAIKAAAIIAFGATEGYAFFRCGLTAPSALIDQMSFQSMLVMKLFLTGVGTSMVCQGLMDVFIPKEFAASRVMSRTTPGLRRAMGGCFLLGLGKTLTGSGPTILPAQMFAMSQNMIYAFAGALCAAGLVHMAEKYDILRTDCSAKVGEKTTLDAKWGMRYYKLAIPAGLTMIAAAVIIDAFWPHQRDVDRIGTHLSNPWNPIAAGLIIGFNQLPLRYLASRGQGGSTSYMNAVATFSGGKLANRFTICNVNSGAQFLYVWIGTALGSAYALSQQRDTGFTPAIGPDPLRAFIGGVLMLGGSRIAAGCTCGHGISGTSELSFQSMAAVMSIFGGGMLSALFIPGLSPNK